jgi:hypothetical protein
VSCVFLCVDGNQLGVRRAVVIQKADLDTCLAGLILGALEAETVIVRVEGATAEELTNAAVLCIEAGGSGDVVHRNFDHHDEDGPRQPACVQAAQAANLDDPDMLRLVDYIAAVDLGRLPVAPRPSFPTLSNLFSGLLLCTGDPVRQFREGMRLLKAVHRGRLDPFGTMPERPEWQPFLNAKRLARATLADDLRSARLFETRRGAKAGIVSTSAPGALGALYELGCRYAIALNRTIDHGHSVKVTIGGKDGALVNHLLPALNGLEQGWGGPSHGTIIGSPRGGSAIDIDRIKDLVSNGC